MTMIIRSFQGTFALLSYIIQGKKKENCKFLHKILQNVKL